MQSLLLLTGTQGVGKTTVCTRLTQLWRKQGGVPGGLATRTAGPERYLVDVATGAERLLAAEGTALAGPRWGRFSFSQEALDWGNEVMQRVVGGPADLVLLDEVGPLELVAREGLLPALKILLGSEKAALVVVRPALMEQVRTMAAKHIVRVYQVTPENREELPPQVALTLMEQAA